MPLTGVPELKDIVLDEIRQSADVLARLAADVDGADDVGEAALVGLAVLQEQLVDHSRHGLLKVLGEVASRGLVLQHVQVGAHDHHWRSGRSSLQTVSYLFIYLFIYLVIYLLNLKTPNQKLYSKTNLEKMSNI